MSRVGDVGCGKASISNFFAGAGTGMQRAGRQTENTQLPGDPPGLEHQLKKVRVRHISFTKPRKEQLRMEAAAIKGLGPTFWI